MEEKDFVTDYVSPGLGGLGHPHPLLQGNVWSCLRLRHFPGGSEGSLSPFVSNCPLRFRAAMQTKVKTTWWWMRSVHRDVGHWEGAGVDLRCPSLCLSGGLRGCYRRRQAAWGGGNGT